MDFKDQIKQIAGRINVLKDNLQTEEATKNALIMPFLAALGYDVFNPLEVLPEMTCDIGKKKGEKIDYAILRDGEPIILIECKHWQQNLNLHDNQLLRYFTVSKAKFGILTNGIIYRFYTDLEEVNKMDEKPFLEINMLELRDAQIQELKKFHKSYFDIENVLCSAGELKYMRELKAEISAEFDEPSVDLVRLLGKRIVTGPFTAKVQDQFTPLVKRALKSYVSDIISQRLNSAIRNEEERQEETVEATETPVVEKPAELSKDDRIVTTEEELEGYQVVKAIVRSVIPVSRIAYRDTISYFGILIDDNNRKPLCRLHFNHAQKYIGLLDENKTETRHKIDCIDDIFNFSEQLVEAAKRYL
ncbi:MAG: type I restriction enzyme HsdR N-terminal domain-containing protein [Bacteroidaceae bacterium]|nr:type I restriction enzyme HsdR N-terminal domain-containing protein [Bacteroidaceae bacterium]